MVALPSLRRGVPVAVLSTAGAVAAAWLLLLVLYTTGHAELVSHDAVFESGVLPLAVATLVFLAVWQLMTAAMMLPTVLPMVGLFSQVSRRQPRPRAVMAGFLGAYFLVWTGFAAVALLADSAVHAVVDAWAWLAVRPELVLGGVLVLAGAFQFSPLKNACLTACRNPFAFLHKHYQRGVPGAWGLGFRHAVFCLGCCWALMFVMFATGVGSLLWMLLLTGVMVIEKTASWGHRLVKPVGAALIAAGSLVTLPVIAAAV